MQIEKTLERMFTEGLINRREFIARLSALGLAATVSPLLMSKEAAAAPKRGGRLVLGSAGGSTTDTLDGGQLTHTMAQTVGQCLRSQLVEVNYKGEAVPELAESWEASPDAAVWTFKLRKDVEFHNGKTMDAEDVMFSINYHRGKDSKSAAKGIVDPIQDIKIENKYTVVFTLKGGNADFPFIMGDYHLAIVPNGTKGAEFEKGIGTGGYILVKHEPGVRALTKRNPNYWKAGRAHFEEVEVINIIDLPARVSALKSGKLDCMNRCDFKTFSLFDKMPGIQGIRQDGTAHCTLAMRPDKAPFGNNEVRQALKYAIDRKNCSR